MSIMPIPLRAGADGPRVGNPPVIATPNLASLVGYLHGASNGDTEISGLDQLVAGMSDEPVLFRANYRYLIVTGGTYTVDADITTSRSFRPTWATRTASGAFPPGHLMPTFRGWSATPTQYAEMLCSGILSLKSSDRVMCHITATELYIPSVDEAALQIGVRVAGIEEGTSVYVRDSSCWAMVWELGGVP